MFAMLECELRFGFKVHRILVSNVSSPSSLVVHKEMKSRRRPPDRTVSKTRSGSVAFVPVMEAADFGNRNDLANGLHRPWIW